MCLTAATSIQAQHSEIPPENQLFRGITLYENGQYKQAVKHLSDFLRHSQNEVQRRQAHYVKALAQAAANPADREFYFERFIAKYPESRDSGLLYIDLAHQSLFDGDLLSANNFYEEALRLGLESSIEPLVLYWNAETYESRRNYQSARSFFRQLSVRFPNSMYAPRALFNKGRLYLAEQRFEEAAWIFEELRRRYPADMSVRRIGTALGQAYYEQALYREAIDALRRELATLDREQEIIAVLMIAESYNYLDELSDAATWYRRYINLTEGTPQERFAHYGLGWVFHKQGVYHWAAESFGRVSDGNDDLARSALYYKAINHKLSGRFDLAMQSFEEFGRRYSDGPWVEQAYYEWAILSFEIGDYVTAIENNLHLLRSGIELQNPGAVYSLLGEAFFANAEYGRAIEAFERAEHFGASEEGIREQARFQRGWVMFRNQAYDEALRMFQSVYNDNPTGPIAGEALFWIADSYFNLGDYASAAANFERFITEFRNHEFTGAARYSLGWSHFNLGRYDEAIQPFQQFLDNFQAPPIAMFPYDTDTKLRLGDSHFALSKYTDAIQFYELALGSDRGADYAKYQIASSYYRMNRTFESVRNFRSLVSDFPQSTLREQAKYNIGYIYLLSGNYSQAATEFQQLLELFPNSRWAARAQFNIGNAYFNAGNNERAIEEYKKVLERYPRSDLIIEAVNGIQFAQESLGREDTSDEILEDFLTRNPQAGTADRLRFRQAERMLQTGDFENAVDAFRQFIRTSNNQRLIAEAWFNLGDAFSRLGKPDDATDAYQTIIRDFSGSDFHNPALFELARMSMRAGNYSQAIEQYETLSRRSRTYRLDANIGIGNANFALSRYARAKESFERALELDSDNDNALLGLAKVAMNTNQRAEALELFTKIADRNNADAGAEAQYLSGRIHQQNRSHEAAIRAFSNVRLFYGGYDEWVSRSMLGSAESNIAVGNRVEADRIIERIIEQYPGTEVARRAAALRQN